MLSFDRVRSKRSHIFDSFGRGRLNGCRPSDVKRVLLIDSASRSGSSFLYYLISRHPDVVSLNGEGGVFERLHGVGAVESPEDSDLLAEGAVPDATLAAVAEDILQDAGCLRREPDELFVLDSVQRLLLQYPELDLDCDRLRGACARALARRQNPFSPAAYWKQVVAELGLERLLPPACVLEEPPFVVPEPRALPAPRELGRKTLLLKSTSDCYRLWMVKKMFPQAEFKFIVLSRNPAASISALADGWLSDGFHSHDLRGVTELSIAGYTRGDQPWTRHWWKFDLPPGWAQFIEKPLEEVCAFQWAAANEHILRDLELGVIKDHLRVAYETFLDDEALSRELSRVWRFSGLDERRAPAPDPAPVMSVSAPAAGKWRKRRGALEPLMGQERVAALARALGYDPAAWQGWP